MQKVLERNVRAVRAWTSEAEVPFWQGAGRWRQPVETNVELRRILDASIQVGFQQVNRRLAVAIHDAVH